LRLFLVSDFHPYSACVRICRGCLVDYLMGRSGGGVDRFNDDLIWRINHFELLQERLE